MTSKYRIKQPSIKKEGDKMTFVKTKDSITLTVSDQTDLSALCGYLPKPKKTLSVEEINYIIKNKTT